MKTKVQLLLLFTGLSFYHFGINAGAFDKLRALGPDFAAFQIDVLMSKQHLAWTLPLNIDFDSYRKSARLNPTDSVGQIIDASKNEVAKLLNDLLTPPYHVRPVSAYGADGSWDDKRQLESARFEVVEYLAKAQAALDSLRQKHHISFSETGLLTKWEALKAKFREVIK